MEALYKIKANELDSGWIESIQKLFHDKNLIIKVSTDMDETEYLSLDPANERHLLENMAAEPSKIFKGNELKEYLDKQQK